MSNFSNFYGPKVYIGPTGGTGGIGITGATGGTGYSGGTGGTGLPGVNGMPWNLISTNTNATAGSGYLINATSGNVTLTLPGVPVAGQSVGICDAYNKATSNTINIARNGANIQGLAEDIQLDVNGISFILSYVDTTIGWKIVSEADNTTNATPVPYSFKNRIINGNMTISQKNASNATTPTTTTAYVVDRFCSYIFVASKLTYQKVTDAPVGFVNSLKISVAAQYAAGAAQAFFIYQPIEGLNIVDFMFGYSVASPITVSFWIKGSVPGNYAISIKNGSTRAYVTTVSVTTSWNRVSVTIPGDITGTWVASDSLGMMFSIDLGSGSDFITTANTWVGTNALRTAGSVSFVNQSVGSTLNITGVQLEKGSVATDFEYRPPSIELSLCQRYYQILSCSAYGYCVSASAEIIVSTSWYPMRVVPTWIKIKDPSTSTNMHTSYPNGICTAFTDSKGDFEIVAAAAGNTWCVDIRYESSGTELI